MRSFFALFFLMACGNLSAGKTLYTISFWDDPFAVIPVFEEGKALVAKWFVEDQSDDGSEIEFCMASPELQRAIDDKQALNLHQLFSGEIKLFVLVPTNHLQFVKSGNFEAVEVFLMTKAETLVQQLIVQMSKRFSFSESPDQKQFFGSLAQTLPADPMIPHPDLNIDPFPIWREALTTEQIGLNQGPHLVSKISWVKPPPSSVDTSLWPEVPEDPTAAIWNIDQSRGRGNAPPVTPRPAVEWSKSPRTAPSVPRVPFSEILRQKPPSHDRLFEAQQATQARLNDPANPFRSEFWRQFSNKTHPAPPEPEGCLAPLPREPQPTTHAPETQTSEKRFAALRGDGGPVSFGPPHQIRGGRFGGIGNGRGNLTPRFKPHSGGQGGRNNPPT